MHTYGEYLHFIKKYDITESEKKEGLNIVQKIKDILFKYKYAISILVVAIVISGVVGVQALTNPTLTNDKIAVTEKGGTFVKKDSTDKDKKKADVEAKEKEEQAKAEEEAKAQEQAAAEQAAQEAAAQQAAEAQAIQQQTTVEQPTYQEPVAQPTPTPTPTPAPSGTLDEAMAILNARRNANGLASLSYDWGALQQAANARANEITGNFAHSHNGGPWYTVLNEYGVSYSSGGENIYYAYSHSYVSAVNAWMDSPGHYQNMMNPSVTRVSIGVVNGYYAMLLVG